MSPPQLCFEFPRTRMDGCYGNPRDWAAPTVDSGLQVVSPFDTRVARDAPALREGGVSDLGACVGRCDTEERLTNRNQGRRSPRC